MKSATQGVPATARSTDLAMSATAIDLQSPHRLAVFDPLHETREKKEDKGQTEGLRQNGCRTTST
jgi:hypothetical protein